MVRLRSGRPRLEVADILRAHGDGYRRQHPVSPEQATVMRHLVQCRTAALGGHVDACDHCGDVAISFNSCRNRHCPKCQGTQRTKWIEDRLERLLPVEHFHVVFTLPDKINPLMLRNKRATYGLLFRAAAESLTQLAADPRRLGAEIGFTAVLHTWGQNLLFHPHLHCVVTGGGLAPDSDRWISARPGLRNHIPDLAAVDFFTVPTVTFRVLYCFVVLRLERRHVVHFNVTSNSTAQWTAQQLVEALPYDEAPRYLMRDRDGVYGNVVRRRIRRMGIEEVISARQSPWQNPFAERLIGSIRRECLDHVIVFSGAHLLRVLAKYFEYYHASRAHQSLAGNAPVPREVEPPERGQVVGTPVLGGLHQAYRRAA